MRRRIPKTAAAPTPETKATPPTSKPKTAVIMVHGMGEQRPLETIRSFVKGVYQSDLSKATKPVPAGRMLEVSIVPDSAFNSAFDSALDSGLDLSLGLGTGRVRTVLVRSVRLRCDSPSG